MTLRSYSRTVFVIEHTFVSSGSVRQRLYLLGIGFFVCCVGVFLFFTIPVILLKLHFSVFSVPLFFSWIYFCCVPSSVSSFDYLFDGLLLVYCRAVLWTLRNFGRSVPFGSVKLSRQLLEIVLFHTNTCKICFKDPILLMCAVSNAALGAGGVLWYSPPYYVN